MPATASSLADPPARLPTLSVVVPNYNHARYLEAALGAHLEQSAPPLEIIVVDDASTDDSCPVVERVVAKHPSVRLLRLSRNGGVIAAMNRGLLEARGDYVCFSAADDLVTSDFAARSLEVLGRYPAAGFCFSDPAQMLGDGRPVQELPLFLSDLPCMLSPADIGRLMKHNYFSFPGHTVLYRRDALLALGGFIEDLRWHADWFASCVLAFRHGACYVPEVLAFFRVSPESYSSRGLRESRLQGDLLYALLDLLESNSFSDVAPCFRASALMPELRPSVLMWLLVSRRHRSYLTRRLVTRVLGRSLWMALSPSVRRRIRRAARRLALRRAWLATIGNNPG